LGKKDIMKLALFGYGGHAREVAAQINKEVLFFVDDEYVNEFTKPVSEFNPETHMMMVAVADSRERKRIVEKLPKETTYFTFIHPTALIMDNNVEIGNGSFVGAYSIITTNVKIGEHSILNRGNQIGHDTVISDFFSAMPGAVVSGNVVVGDNVYMGTNSSIKEKLHICSNVTIGSNGAVVKNLITGGVYVGVPVKFKKK
jgi:sugar O-acyltransferase (sialic acid O-acetyltransferase NeuD family)